MELRDRELVLRPPASADLDALVAACDDPEIAAFTILVPSPYTVDDGRAFLEAVGAAWRDGAPERVFAILADGAFCGIVSVDLHDGVVGYWLARRARGRGLMTRAVRLVVGWARAEGAGRLSLTTHPDNEPSQRVAERAGFRRVGTVTESPAFRDGTSERVLFELV